MSTPHMNDTTNFVQVSCSTADAILCGSRAENLGSGRGTGWGRILVSSSLTDPDGHYGTPTVYTEWSFEKNDYVVMREYLWPDSEKPCEHWVPEPGFDHKKFLGVEEETEIEDQS